MFLGVLCGATAVDRLNAASVDMPRPVKADLLIFIYLDDPTILDNQSNRPEADCCQRLSHQSFKVPAPGFRGGL